MGITTAHRSSHALTIEQENALDLLVTGASDRAVGEQVGVARETVTRWRANPFFSAALNRRRQELWASHTERLRAMVGGALDTLEKAVGAGDRKVALAVLKAADLGAGFPSGPTDAEEILRAEAEGWAKAQERREWDAEIAKVPEDEQLLVGLGAMGRRERRQKELTEQRLAELLAEVEAEG
jgi:hypothetical protein